MLRELSTWPDTVIHLPYTSRTGTITITPVRAVFENLARYYADVFGNSRNEYVIPRGALTDTTKQCEMAASFWPGPLPPTAG